MHHHSFPKTLAGLLAMACFIGAQYACQPDEAAQPEGQMDAEHAEDAGRRRGSLELRRRDRCRHVGWAGPPPSRSATAACSSLRSTWRARSRRAEARLRFSGSPPTGRWWTTGTPSRSTWKTGSSISLEGRQFSLLQFHFHLPSEHTAEGASYPMEVHFVHQAAEGDLAVIGVFMDSGDGPYSHPGHMGCHTRRWTRRPHRSPLSIQTPSCPNNAATPGTPAP